MGYFYVRIDLILWSCFLLLRDIFIINRDTSIPRDNSLMRFSKVCFSWSKMKNTHYRRCCKRATVFHFKLSEIIVKGKVLTSSIHTTWRKWRAWSSAWKACEQKWKLLNHFTLMFSLFQVKQLWWSFWWEQSMTLS